MIWSVADEIVETTDLKQTESIIKKFLSALEMDHWIPSDFPSSCISVSGAPFELSVSGKDAIPLIRLLVEPVDAGEGLTARCLNGINKVCTLSERLGMAVSSEYLKKALAAFFPNGERLNTLNWYFAIWPAIRSDGNSHALRLYLNCNLENDLFRRQIVYKWLSDFTNSDRNGIESILVSTLGWSSLVGVSCDVGSSIALARIHFAAGDGYVGGIIKILEMLGQNKEQKTVSSFLACLSRYQPHQMVPLLISLGCDDGSINSIKLDWTLKDIKFTPHQQNELHAELNDCIGCNHLTSLAERLNNKLPLQYVGMTIPSNGQLPYLNSYYGFPGAKCRFEQHSSSFDLKLALAKDYVNSVLQKGALMDARSQGDSHRSIPASWIDGYISGLILELEQPPSFLLNASTINTLVNSLHLSQAQKGGWQYLPSLPVDVDTSSMALIGCLCHGRSLTGSDFLKNVKAVQCDNGGFLTFVDPTFSQQAHPAVTINVVHALDTCGMAEFAMDAISFLKNWILSTDFPSAQWMYSPLISIYLMSRVPLIRNHLDAKTISHVISEVYNRQRNDGTWGTSLPEVLETAMAVMTLRNFASPIPKIDQSLEYLMEAQAVDGGWCWAPIFSDGDGLWFGHRALTSVMAVKAIMACKCAVR